MVDKSSNFLENDASNKKILFYTFFFSICFLWGIISCLFAHIISSHSVDSAIKVMLLRMHIKSSVCSQQTIRKTLINFGTLLRNFFSPTVSLITLMYVISATGIFFGLLRNDLFFVFNRVLVCTNVLDN